ncbi:MAG: glycoside hydrolase family 5 protein [Candidatus Anammoximicrobium sp.]|nr:glycoside hydrolase family 5 protein [Candidatus Anammoximicrobium sp.]
MRMQPSSATAVPRLHPFGRLAIILLTALGWLGTAGRAAETLGQGAAVLDADFETSPSDSAWAGQLRYATGFESPRSLCVDHRSGGNPPTIRVPLPAENLRGCTLRGSAMVKADGVSAKPNPWNGIKFMLAIETSDRKLWPQAALDTGSFDWQRAVFSAKVPADATAATLVLGLEQVTGTVCFDNVRIVVAKLPSTAKPAPAPGIAFKGHALPRLRGAMVSPNIDEDGLRTLGREWNANVIRWQLVRHGRPGQPSSLEDYDAWLEGALKRLDAALPLCQRYGIYVVVDLHSPPGGKSTVSGYVGSDDRLFTNRAVQDKFVELWRGIARRYKDVAPIWGFDLANEPVEEFVEEGCDDWHALAERTARAIREIDPQRTIILEAPPWGGPDSLADFTPIAVPNVVYSAHMYVPGQFTHQGVHQRDQPPVTYPGEIGGKSWDKAALQAALQPVIDFQKNYNVHIYIGEFSAIRWAPGDSACRYLRDVIEICEEHGWDWSYHAFREWSGWSVEHGPDRNDTQPAAQPTDRQRLLREWFAKNQKPTWMRQD